MALRVDTSRSCAGATDGDVDMSTSPVDMMESPLDMNNDLAASPVEMADSPTAEQDSGFETIDSPVMMHDSPVETSSPAEWAAMDSSTLLSPIDDTRGESQSGKIKSSISEDGKDRGRTGSRPKPSSLLKPPETIISPPSPVDTMVGRQIGGQQSLEQVVEDQNERDGHAGAGRHLGQGVQVGERTMETAISPGSAHHLPKYDIPEKAHSISTDRPSSPSRSPGKREPVPLAATNFSSSPLIAQTALSREPSRSPGIGIGSPLYSPGTPYAGTGSASAPAASTPPPKGHAKRDSLAVPSPATGGGMRDYFSHHGGTPPSAGPSDGLAPGPLSPRSPTPSSPGFHARSHQGHHRRLSSTHRVRESKGEQKSDADGARMVNQYKFVKALGKGMFAKVEMAVDVGTGKEYAIKEFSQSRLHYQNLQEKHRLVTRKGAKPGPKGSRPAGADTALRDPYLTAEELEERQKRTPEERDKAADDESKKDPLALIRREIAVMKKLDHPNILKLYEAIALKSADALFLVLEYMPGGVLMDVRLGEQPTSPPFPVHQAREYFRQLCLGLEYLHANEVLHRDIKPENILLSKDREVVKLCDFGVSELFVATNDDRIKKSGGSPAFLSPETLSGTSDNIHGKLVDIYALGVTLYCMLTGGLPFNTENPIELSERVQNEDPPIPKEWHESQRDIVWQMLRKEPTWRIHMFMIREHDWVTEHGSNPMIDRDCNLYEVGKLVGEPTEEEISSAIGALRGAFTVIRAVQKLRRMQLARRSISSSGSNPNSPPATSDSSVIVDMSRLPKAFGSMDSYGSSELQTEATSQGTDEKSNPDRTKWHTDEDKREQVGSPRRMDSGYADSLDGREGGEQKAGRGSVDRDVTPLRLGDDRSNATQRDDRQREAAEQVYDWDCRDILADSEEKEARYALVILNQAMPARWVFEQVWKSAMYRICADGGANRLFDSLNEEDRRKYLPDLIKGDLDSLRQDVESYYSEQGVQVVRDPDQNSTDLMKCLDVVDQRERGTPIPRILLGGLCGRVDQTVHTMSLLHKLCGQGQQRIFVVSGESLAWTLPSGSHNISIDHGTMGQTCGILPVGIERAHVQTKGLKWDLDGATSFNGLVSTSNHLLPEQPLVKLRTDRALLWCIEIKAETGV